MNEETDEAGAWIAFLLTVATLFAWCAIGERLL